MNFIPLFLTMFSFDSYHVVIHVVKFAMKVGVYLQTSVRRKYILDANVVDRSERPYVRTEKVNRLNYCAMRCVLKKN